jgi:signal transduction histidine kinase
MQSSFPPNHGATAGVPARVRWLGYLLFCRLPLPEEVNELQAALASLRRRWPWLAAGYVVLLALLVVPGLLRERDGWYMAMSILVPHFLLYLGATVVAYSWFGYRINATNLLRFDASQPHSNRRKRQVLLMWAAGFALGAVVAVLGFEGQVLDHIKQAFVAWNRDTFTNGVLLVMFALMVIGVPELVAQLRLKERTLARQLLEAEATRERMARFTAASELRLLQAQVEPHFLYNTLANLRYLVQSGSTDALKMTDALIEYLRTSVPDMRSQQVTLGREVDHAHHYLQIMTIRMGGRLRHTIEVDEALRAVPLPPLVVLTLVENAIKHGIAPRLQGGTVALRARRSGEFAQVDIEDDGAGFGANSGQGAAGRNDLPSAGTGLANIRKRLGIAYGDAASLELLPLNSDGSGTRARLRVPLTMAQDPTSRPQVEVLSRAEGQRVLAQLQAAPAPDAPRPQHTGSAPAP